MKQTRLKQYYDFTSLMEGDETKTIGAVETSLALVRAVERLDEPRLTVLADELNVSKSTVHHHAATLVQGGFLSKRGDAYEIGPLFLQLGNHARQNEQLYRLGKYEVQQLAHETKALVYVGIEWDKRGVLLYQSSGTPPEETESKLGTQIALPTTAAGKAILSQMSEDRVDEILAFEESPQPRVSRTELADELSEIRDRQVAFDDGEHLPGVRSVAAPINISEEANPGAISVSAPVDRMDERRFRKEFPSLIRNAAVVIEQNSTSPIIESPE